eukprot:scaffold14.g1298.t1
MGKRVYNLRQSISNVAAGVLATMLGVFMKALHVFPYAWLHARCGLLPEASRSSAWVNAVAFLGVDLGFYLFHRAAHATNLGWSAHIVHHSSPDFNLSTALRQGAGESTVSWLFYLPLAFIAPLEVCALHRGINTVFQFFVHSELVPKLWRPIELLMNTPSHHRVHHARNYPRSNFAGIFIVWDRLLDTFEEEEEDRPCMKPQGTYNPLLHQTLHLAATLRLAAAAAGPRQLLSALLTRRHGPGMVRPSVTDAAGPAAGGATGGAAGRQGQQQRRKADGEGLAPDPRRPNGLSPWEERPIAWLDWYAALQFFGMAVPVSFLLLLHAQRLAAAGPAGAAAVAAGVALQAWGVASLGTLCGGERRAARAELLRLAVWQAAALGALAAARRGGAALPAWAAAVAWGVALESLLAFALLAWQLRAGSAAARSQAAQGGGRGSVTAGQASAAKEE